MDVLDPRSLDVTQLSEASLLGLIDGGFQTVDDLCLGRRRWTMTVPVERTDPDIVLTAALMAGREALRRLGMTK